MIRKFQQTVQRLRASRAARGAVTNAGWSGASFLVGPILQVAATPYLLGKLGAESYGVWMLVNSVISISGIASLGLAPATVKFVSQYKARGESSALIRTIRSTMTAYLLLGLLAAVCLAILAPYISRFFNVTNPPDREVLTSAIRVGSLGLFVRFAYAVVEAVAQGYGRYDVESRYAMFNTSVSILASVSVASMGYGVVTIIWANVCVLVLGLISLGIAVARLTGTASWLVPLISLTHLKEIFGFAVWSWLQSLSGILLSQVDKLAIGFFLGPAFVAYYMVCVQLTNLVHGLSARMTSFVFPASSALKETNDSHKLFRLYRLAMPFTTAFGCALCMPLFLFSHSLLTAWVGAEVATASGPTLRIMALATAIASTSIIPYHLMNGWGYVRLNAVLAMISGLMVALGNLTLIPMLGLAGAGWARLCNLPTGIIGRTIIQRKVFGIRSLLSGLAILLPVAAVYLLATALLSLKALPSPNHLILLGVHSILASAIAFVVAYATSSLTLKSLSKGVSSSVSPIATTS